ncbi:MAG: T9SS type A sorting domain-containing protein, partial [Aliifodinibius sp.]|nr:T9SS type A sorting domain-containing protein [Fodinibius sp.]NIV10272.1 T9SS type A sorting domain-containing protein [Fodinibius sp.]NIY23902.1 T9SS type A sorting domain-containing protein [Fodinibius sp.]
NGGHYWECISNTIAQLHESITKIAINPLNTQIVFVGTGGSGDVMRTTDGGLTWIPTGLQLDAVYDLEIDSRNPDIVYAGGTTGGFYKSEDGGITWMEYNDGLPSSLTIRAIEIDHTANKLFLASKDSVYQSQMTPIYWNEINNGLPAHSLIIRSMKLDSITSTLYLGTNHGIYAYDVLTNLDDKAFEQLERFVLYQNYPNPFNPETVISYQLPVASDVELSVYNILGQKVRTLVKGRQSAGRHEVTWDGRDDGGVKVSSGVYVYQLKIGKTVLSRK